MIKGSNAKFPIQLDFSAFQGQFMADFPAMFEDTGKYSSAISHEYSMNIPLCPQNKPYRFCWWHPNFYLDHLESTCLVVVSCEIPKFSGASTVTTSRPFQERCGCGGLMASLSVLAWGCDRIGTLVVEPLWGYHWDEIVFLMGKSSPFMAFFSWINL